MEGVDEMKHLAIFGTASDVGKSVVATALCRIFSDRGVRVAPYKAQNMSNNSGVTPDGLEMGRAQIVQAEAARVVPSVEMNPVLLKPSAEKGVQVVLRGEVWSGQSSNSPSKVSDILAQTAKESLLGLMKRYELLIIEGAGSCAEMNLYDRDFVNFKTARISDAAVILVADIDRGGVFAQVVGTLAVLPPEDRAMVKGVIINRFRGDIHLFADGVRMLEEMTHVPILGVIPYFRHITIDAEDAVTLDPMIDSNAPLESGKIAVAVLSPPHISNFTDLQALQNEGSVQLRYLQTPVSLKPYQALILPGSKNVRSDLAWLRELGWESRIREFRESGGVIVGICGGFQMLGVTVKDPYGVEGVPGESHGLGLLPLETVLERRKTLCHSAGVICGEQVRVSGYEIHMGKTRVIEDCKPFLRISSRNGSPDSEDEGAWSEDRRVFGCYLHGLFDEPDARSWFLHLLDPKFVLANTPVDKQANYDLLADHFRKHVNMNSILEIAGMSQ
jgi:adenosylcobyric acid synthase